MIQDELHELASKFMKLVDDRCGLDLKFGGDGDEGEEIVTAMVDLAMEGQISFDVMKDGIT